MRDEGPKIGSEGFELLGKGCCRTSWVGLSGFSPDAEVKVFSGTAAVLGEERRSCKDLCRTSADGVLTAGSTGLGSDVAPFTCIGYEWSPPELNYGRGARCELYREGAFEDIAGVATELELIGVDRAPAQCKGATKCYVRGSCPAPAAATGGGSRRDAPSARDETALAVAVVGTAVGTLAVVGIVAVGVRAVKSRFAAAVDVDVDGAVEWDTSAEATISADV